MRTFTVLVLAALAAAATESPLSAQTDAVTDVGERAAGAAQADPAPTVAQRLALPAHAGELLAPATDTAPIDAAVDLPVQRTGRGTALAVVGGALFVGGLIAGGDAGTLMVVAGAGIGAYGLYLMLST